jgi:hypothetical protein
MIKVYYLPRVWCADKYMLRIMKVNDVRLCSKDSAKQCVVWLPYAVTTWVANTVIGQIAAPLIL